VPDVKYRLLQIPVDTACPGKTLARMAGKPEYADQRVIDFIRKSRACPQAVKHAIEWSILREKQYSLAHFRYKKYQSGMRHASPMAMPFCK